MRGSVKAESVSNKHSKLWKLLSILVVLVIAFDKSWFIRSISSLKLCGWWSGAK